VCEYVVNELIRSA